MVAITILKLTSAIVAILFLSSSFIRPINSQEFSRQLSIEELGLKWPKFTRLEFYFNVIITGSHPTEVRIASAPSTANSSTFFGSLAMTDDPLTEGPSMSSKIVGMAQGMYGGADMKVSGLLMVMNFLFTDGEFNGSTLSLLGRNELFSAVREMPIVGGSGAFRFARGYAEARTHEYNLKTGNAVVGYNVTVLHY